jgi:hypothetical protein
MSAVFLMTGEVVQNINNVYIDRLQSVEYFLCFGKLLGGCCICTLAEKNKLCLEGIFLLCQR